MNKIKMPSFFIFLKDNMANIHVKPFTKNIMHKKIPPILKGFLKLM